MKKYELISNDVNLYRVIEIFEDETLVFDCKKKTMPFMVSNDELKAYEVVSEFVLPKIKDIEDYTPNERKVIYKRYGMVSAILPFISDKEKRNEIIEKLSRENKKSKQTVRTYLCNYLVYMSISALMSPKKEKKNTFTEDEKNMRWALNKYYYNRNCNSLKTAYTQLIKNRYVDEFGEVFDEYPSFNQFRYFYRKTRSLEKYYISRDGLKNYQRNNRLLLGDGVQEFAPNVGTAMFDGTVCDIYLVNDNGDVVGRPILLAACDANTSLCIGYSLLWEGGIYSLKNLMLNIISDKVDLCEKMGISIKREQWDCDKLPGVIVTDGGREYTGNTFEQIAELGVTLVNLPPYRPELKGPVEKLFDLVQSTYKDYLKNKGVIMPDFQERGAHDYRKDACLTLTEFERIIVRCIVYYNSERIIENYPYTKEMLSEKIAPHASDIWNYKKELPGTNLISVSSKELVLTLMPRTTGVFTRHGLKVCKLRYYADGYKEKMLEGGTVSVAYNPDNCNVVWLHNENGRYEKFSLIETRFIDNSFDNVKKMQNQQKTLIEDYTEENLKSRIQVADFIDIVTNEKNTKVSNITNIRERRKKAINETHIDYGGEIGG